MMYIFVYMLLRRNMLNFLYVCFVRDKGIVLLIVLFFIFLDIGMLFIKE